MRNSRHSKEVLRASVHASGMQSQLSKWHPFTDSGRKRGREWDGWDGMTSLNRVYVEGIKYSRDQWNFEFRHIWWGSVQMYSLIVTPLGISRTCHSKQMTGTVPL